MTKDLIDVFWDIDEETNKAIINQIIQTGQKDALSYLISKVGRNEVVYYADILGESRFFQRMMERM